MIEKGACTGKCGSRCRRQAADLQGCCRPIGKRDVTDQHGRAVCFQGLAGAGNCGSVMERFCTMIGRHEFNQFDAGFVERTQLAIIGNAVLVEILPDAELIPARIMMIENIVTIGIKGVAQALQIGYRTTSVINTFCLSSACRSSSVFHRAKAISRA